MTICSICLEHLEKPVCCIPCGHLYCNQCISDWRNGHSNRCPECREPITTVQSIYLDTESIKEMFVERTRLNDCVKELTANIEKLRQDQSNEDQKVLELGEMKRNFERAKATCHSLQIRNSTKALALGEIKDKFERSKATCQGLQLQHNMKLLELMKMKDKFERAEATCQRLQLQNNLKLLELVEIKGNFERAKATCQSLQLQNNKRIARCVFYILVFVYLLNGFLKNLSS